MNMNTTARLSIAIAVMKSPEDFAIRPTDSFASACANSMWLVTSEDRSSLIELIIAMKFASFSRLILIS